MEVIILNRDIYSNIEFTELKERINREILRRGTFSWWDPLTTPSVGVDKTSPLNIPDVGERFQVDEKTYTINNPSEGSVERTRNIEYPNQGENPAGQNPDSKSSLPNTSAALMTVDELRNFIVGLVKINDVNLFYGRDEVKNTAFRDPQEIENSLVEAENSELNRPLHLSDNSPTKVDPNGGITNYKNPNYPVYNKEITYPMENGVYVMPSGEYDGEETNTYARLGPSNFYDDFGAKPGDGDYHPFNKYTSIAVRRDWNDQDNYRNSDRSVIIQGGIPSSSRFGPNPRNPQQGNPYISRPVKGGVHTSCRVSCTGLCHVTCDNECSESCSSTCWGRCGNACTATCGNVCTGCSTLCYSSCKTKCENSTGYSCVKSGAKTVNIYTTGGHDGITAENHIDITTYSCVGCSYSCQFYPNKKTTCWDAGCMGNCYISCSTACSTSCYGGCIDNSEESDGDYLIYYYKIGHGRGCGAGCTLNCIGNCSGVCQGDCISTCWHGCMASCSDNCEYACTTNCGSGCMNKCTNYCTGCSSCVNECTALTIGKTCTGCSSKGGCFATCQHDCNTNCVGWGCKSICGVEASGACDANCRINCTNTSCTAMCSDACSTRCSTCVNTCGFQCGYCSSACSNGCTDNCNITCTDNCVHSCNTNCVHSCSEECGGCSNLCYSCVGMCIGVCSVKCESGCSSCTKMCGWWCDSSCNQQCFSNCDTFCINTCSGSCATFVTSDTTTTSGPERKPTSDGYIHPDPSNRNEERESFKNIRDIKPYKK